MALSQIYTAVSGDTITAARWNNEFGNIYNNGTDIAFPLIRAVSLAGFTITWDAAGATTMVSSASQGMNYTAGSKSGTPGANGTIFNYVAQTFTDSNTAGSGTAALWAGVSLRTPTLAASNTLVTTTDAATLYIEGPPTAGTNETLTIPSSLLVASGATTLRGSLWLAEGANIASAATTNIWSTDGSIVHITGTTAITSLGTAPQAGSFKVVVFDGVLTLTHGTNLNISGAANITTSAGDVMIAYADTTTQIDILHYAYGGAGVHHATFEALTSGTSLTVPAGITRVDVEIFGASGGGGGGGEAGTSASADGTSGGAGGAGGTTSFNAGAFTTTGGVAGPGGSGHDNNAVAGYSGANHGVGSGGTINRTGGGQSGGNGGGGGMGSTAGSISGLDGQPGGRGGDGGYVRGYVTVVPGATVTYAIGAGGTAGTAGSGAGDGADGGVGRAGQAGVIVLHY